MSRVVKTGLIAFFLGVWAGGLLLEATILSSRYDEPLWTMRSRVSPLRLSPAPYDLWAIDIPQMNRWTHYAALKLTGLDKHDPNERRLWDKYHGRFYCFGSPVPAALSDRIGTSSLTLAEWEDERGPYFSLERLWLMRYVNLLEFFLGVFALWWTAARLLRSWPLGFVCVTPFALSPIFALDLAFVSHSGEIELFCALSWFLLAWTHLDCRLTRSRIIICALLAGVCASAKQSGLLAPLVLCLYLAWRSRHWERVWNPLMAAALAFAAFAVINPVFLLRTPTAWLDTFLQIWARRKVCIEYNVLARPESGLPSVLKALAPYSALFILNLVLSWRALAYQGVRAVAIWGTTLWVGMALGFSAAGVAAQRWFGPVELGLFYSLAVLSLQTRPPGSQDAAVPADARTAAAPLPRT